MSNEYNDQEKGIKMSDQQNEELIDISHELLFNHVGDDICVKGKVYCVKSIEETFIPDEDKVQQKIILTEDGSDIGMTVNVIFSRGE